MELAIPQPWRATCSGSALEVATASCNLPWPLNTKYNHCATFGLGVCTALGANYQWDKNVTPNKPSVFWIMGQWQEAKCSFHASINYRLSPPPPPYTNCLAFEIPVIESTLLYTALWMMSSDKLNHNGFKVCPNLQFGHPGKPTSAIITSLSPDKAIRLHFYLQSPRKGVFFFFFSATLSKII